MSLVKHINFKGDLFSTTVSFSAQALIKLGSSLVLTRILRPDDFGVITILMSILFVIEMIGDLGINLFIIRDANGEAPRYLNTAWTMRLARATLNSAVVFVGASFIASLYHAPALTNPLRMLSVWFIIAALESMSYPIAIRRNRSRIIVYSELAAAFLSTVFSVLYCYYSRDYWGIVYGTLLNRCLFTLISYRFYKEFRPKIHFDLAAAREVLGFTKFTMPSSLLTLALSQFDKIVFLRLFDLRLLGVYGLAGNMAGPVESLIGKISQMVLYPRMAHAFRSSRETFSLKYYTENAKLFFSILVLPAMIGGAAHLIISILYPARYAEADTVLRAFMVRAAILSLSSPPEDLLIAAGESQVILVGNVLRAIWIVAACFGGYHLFGFVGFTYGAALSGLAPLAYYLWLQHAKGFLILRYEFYKVGFVVGAAALAYLTSTILWALWSAVHVKI